MQQYIDIAKTLGLRVITDSTGLLVKGLDWTSKPITHEAHFKNLILKTIRISAPEIKKNLSSLRKLVKSRPTETVKIAYNSLYETVKAIRTAFPDIKF
jgi:hypothetical protein